MGGDDEPQVLRVVGVLGGGRGRVEGAPSGGQAVDGEVAMSGVATGVGLDGQRDGVGRCIHVDEGEVNRRWCHRSPNVAVGWLVAGQRETRVSRAAVGPTRRHVPLLTSSLEFTDASALLGMGRALIQPTARPPSPTRTEYARRRLLDRTARRVSARRCQASRSARRAGRRLGVRGAGDPAGVAHVASYTYEAVAPASSSGTVAGTAVVVVEHDPARAAKVGTAVAVEFDTGDAETAVALLSYAIRAGCTPQK
jgi:hypothetical protein